jgi:hypothetical protein
MKPGGRWILIPFSDEGAASDSRWFEVQVGRKVRRVRMSLQGMDECENQNPGWIESTDGYRAHFGANPR